MKKVLLLFCVLFLALSPVGAQATSDMPRFKATAGGKQLFIQYDQFAVSSENGQITAAQTKKSTLIASNAMNGIFYAGRYVVGFGASQGKGDNTWFSYNIDNGQLKYTIIPTKSAPFWGDAKGLYYADLASKPNIFRYDPASGKTQKLLSSIIGEPCGYFGNRLICFDSTKSRILSYDAKNNLTVLYSDGIHILSVVVVNQQVFVSRVDGLYRLDDSKLTQLYKGYAPIIAVAEPYFINVTSEDSVNTLQGTLSLYLNDATNATRASITQNAGLSASIILNSPGISSNGAALTFVSPGTDPNNRTFPLPKPSNMRPY